jgi:hypothetical protein
MNAETFAVWLQRQGYCTVHTESSYWYEASPHVYQAFPYHWLVEPSEKELSCLFHTHRAVALRYSTPASALQGKLSYHVICEGSYELGNVPRQARQNTSRGLKYAEITQIPLDRLAREGWPLRQDTLARQGRVGAESCSWWCRLCQSAQGLPGIEAWGALHEGELVASFIGFRCDDCYLLPYEQSATAHLASRVNNAIFYSVTHQVLQRPGVRQVFFCLQSLDAPGSVDEFKFRMGYTARPVRQRVVFHPRLSFLCNTVSHRAITRLIRLLPNRPALTKAEGMLRFYLDGLRPVGEQEWPESLMDHRHELLASL